MRKKRLFFFIESMNCAGAEKSLLTFLSVLDYSKFDVDLQLMSYGGEFESYLPKEVNKLPPLEYVRFSAFTLKEQLRYSLKHFSFKYLVARILYSLSLISVNDSTNHTRSARYYWDFIGECFPKVDKKYDVAIGYAQTIPTFYVVEKVVAGIKFGWVNCIYHLTGKERDFQYKFYKQLSFIINVSDSANDHFKTVYPEFSNKMHIIWDMMDANIISSMSNNGPSFTDNFNGVRLLTVSRLNKEEKGFDIALETCKILKERGLNFKWYVLGRGPYKEEMVSFIQNNRLEDNFIFLGTNPNPYSYIKNCDIYVQTSRIEGFGLSIAEARILNRPVVTTNFDAVLNQMVPGKNGLVVEQNPIAVANAVEQLLEDRSLYNAIIAYQMREKKSNVEEIDKFYSLLENKVN